MIDMYFAENYDEAQEMLHDMATDKEDQPIYIGSGEDMALHHGVLFVDNYWSDRAI